MTTNPYVPSDAALTEARLAAEQAYDHLDDPCEIGEAAVRAAAPIIKMNVLRDLESALHEHFPFEFNYDVDPAYLSLRGEARIDMMGEIITLIDETVNAEHRTID